MHMVLSIIVPVFNAEQYVDKCIQSIANGKQNIEIVLIDDGSTDNSLDICNAWSTRDDRIMVVHTENQGVSKARNLGLSLIHGDYVMFVDIDDWIDTNIIDQILSKINQHNPDLITFNTTKHQGDSVYTTDNPSGLFESSDAIGLQLDHMFQNFTMFQMCSKVFKTSIIRELSLQFPEDASLGEDAEFSCQFLTRVNSLVSLESPAYHYMLHSGTLSNKFYSNILSLHYNTFQNVMAVYLQRSIITENRKNAVVRYYLGSLRSGLESLFSIGCTYSYADKIAFIQSYINDKRYREYVDTYGSRLLTFAQYLFMKQRNPYIIYLVLAVWSLKRW